MGETTVKNKSHVHFIGIGGIGMSGIAQLFLNQGVKVSGSDLKENTITQELKKSGAAIFRGHDQRNIFGADVVVYSSAVKEDNPEIIAAKDKGVTLLKRAQALAFLMRDKAAITVAGSHGKTTVTSLVSCLLIKAGLCPTVAIGGILKNISTNARAGEGKFFVAEADESDGSFLYYAPKYSIITNIDREHLDYYGDFEREIETFREFIARTRPDGCVFCCDDDVNLKNILAAYKNRHVLFGLTERAHVYPKHIEINGLSSQFDCYCKNKLIGRFDLALGGMHNISNALSVIALGLELKIDTPVIQGILKEYKGVSRRMEIKFKNKEFLIIDDYAHHPTEIKATLAAVKNLQVRRIIALFQPHRFSRTQALLDEFGKSFDFADHIVITDIYPASELPIPGITGRCVYDKIKAYAREKEAYFLPKEEITPHVIKIMKPGDLIITLGAGDIVKVCDELVERIKGQR
jgi:UDP-N-acetylmuramate--alanine ligase